MELTLHLERDGGRPLYRQIVDQIRDGIRAGRLRPGQRLPTVRALAGRLDVTRLTVHRAFRDLQTGGWLEATVGRGTFVRGGAPPAGAASGTVPGSDPQRGLTADAVMAEILQYGADPKMKNLAHSEPDPSLIPAGAFWDCLESLRRDASAHLQYVSSQGDAALRREIAAFVRGRGIEARPDEILVTSGVTQGLSLLAQALGRPGDRVAVEQPTYLGLLHILEAQGLKPIGVPLDREGPRLDVLERVVAQDRPRFFYTIATYHNPTGRSMSKRRRRDLLALAERRGFTIVEDDIYHHLSYDRPPPPALRSLDRGGRVIYLDGVSKAVLPGVRAGYVLAGRPLLDRMLSLRRAADLCGPLTIQRALAEFLRRGMMASHMKRVLPRYRRRRDALMRALEKSMPEGVTWTRPEGGFCCWLTLPAGGAFRDLHRAALDRGLIVAPGEVFLVDPEPREGAHLRLCFGNQTEATIREAVAILAGLVRERMTGRPSPRRPMPDRAPLV